MLLQSNNSQSTSSEGKTENYIEVVAHPCNFLSLRQSQLEIYRY